MITRQSFIEDFKEKKVSVLNTSSSNGDCNLCELLKLNNKPWLTYIDLNLDLNVIFDNSKSKCECITKILTIFNQSRFRNIFLKNLDWYDRNITLIGLTNCSIYLFKIEALERMSVSDSKLSSVVIDKITNSNTLFTFNNCIIDTLSVKYPCYLSFYDCEILSFYYSDFTMINQNIKTIIRKSTKFPISE